MRAKAMSGAFLALILLATGCLAPGRAPLDTGAAYCMTAAPSEQCASSVSTHPSRFGGSSCEVLGPHFQTATALFDPRYPAGVKGFHSQLVSASFQVLTCRQLSWPGFVAENFQLAMMATLIDTPAGGNQSVEDNFFVHQAYTNSREFAQNSSTGHGFFPQVIPHVPIRIAPTPTSANTVEFNLPQSSPQYSLRGLVDLQESGRLRTAYGYVFAAVGKDKTAYFVIESSGKSNTFSPGLMTFGSESYVANHSRLPAMPIRTIHDFDLTLTLEMHEMRAPNH